MLKNLSLYISAFIPMYFLLDLKLFVDILNGNLSWNVLNIIMFVLLLVLICYGIFGIFWNVKFNTSESLQIVITKKQNITDQHFLGYFSLFVLFAVSFDLSRFCMVCVLVVILTLIGVVYLKNDLFYINPFLNILGFNFYEITFYIIGNEKEIKHAKMFYKGDLLLTDKIYWAKLKNKNFTFIDNSKNKMQ